MRRGWITTRHFGGAPTSQKLPAPSRFRYQSRFLRRSPRRGLEDFFAVPPLQHYNGSTPVDSTSILCAISTRFSRVLEGPEDESRGDERIKREESQSEPRGDEESEGSSGKASWLGMKTSSSTLPCLCSPVVERKPLTTPRRRLPNRLGMDVSFGGCDPW